MPRTDEEMILSHAFCYFKTVRFIMLEDFGELLYIADKYRCGNGRTLAFAAPAVRALSSAYCYRRRREASHDAFRMYFRAAFWPL